MKSWLTPLICPTCLGDIGHDIASCSRWRESWYNRKVDPTVMVVVHPSWFLA